MGPLEDTENFKRRRLTLSDDEGRHIEMKLWGKHANMQFQVEEQVTMHGLRVDKFNMRTSLSSTNSTQRKVIFTVLKFNL